LRRFAVAITVLNILGHTFFGFEQSPAQPLVALTTAYACEILLDRLESWGRGRAPRFAGGWRSRVDFLLSPHITALAVAMLLYTNERLWPTVFATAVAICSKCLLRAPVGRGMRHFFNPSNFGITVTLLLFPWVGIAPPYHFTENLDRYGDWVFPAAIILTGSFLNTRFTRRMPLIFAWAGTFFAQALTRSLVLGTPLVPALLPMTSIAFILYTFYMVTDPGTTPQGRRGQVLFGAGVALAYGCLMVAHVVFGLFFALTMICALRGVGLYASAWVAERSRSKLQVQAPAIAREA
jgi:Na+-translocating ferredoxin:NAD+ oxidoreductase RnfD subunit